MECTALPVIMISSALLLAYCLGTSTGFAHGGLFGTAVATMGMLATAAYILAMDTFGPIADNAGGIIEMSKQPKEVRDKADRLRRCRQHDQGAHERVRDRLGRPCSVPALLSVPG